MSGTRRFRRRAAVFLVLVGLIASGPNALTVLAAPGASTNAAVPAAAEVACAPGAHTLSKFGDRVYPEMGNGGYTSVHTDVYMIYDAATNLFLPGNHVDLTDEATQCLTDFSLDFERSSAGPHRRPEHDRGLGHRERPAGDVRVRPADLPRRPERAGRPRSAGPCGLERQPGQRDQPEPAGLLTPGQRQLPERHPVPGEQAGDHARRRRSRAGRRSSVTVNYTGRPGRAPRRRRHDRGLVPRRTRPRRRTTAASSPPSRSAPWPGCRSTTTRPPSRPTTSTTPSPSARRRSRPASSSGDPGPTLGRSPHGGQPAGCELPGRLVTLALAFAGAGRQLPGRATASARTT